MFDSTLSIDGVDRMLCSCSTRSEKISLELLTFFFFHLSSLGELLLGHFSFGSFDCRVPNGRLHLSRVASKKQGIDSVASQFFNSGRRYQHIHRGDTKYG